MHSEQERKGLVAEVGFSWEMDSTASVYKKPTAAFAAVGPGIPVISAFRR